MTVTRVAIKDIRLVYVILANKNLQYPKGRSRIAYIGTTKNGVARVAQSAAYRTDEILALHGVKEFEVRIIACNGRQKVSKIWHKLERTALMAFREKYGAIPRCNSQGKGITERAEFALFNKARIFRILEALA